MNNTLNNQAYRWRSTTLRDGRSTPVRVTRPPEDVGSPLDGWRSSSSWTDRADLPRRRGLPCLPRLMQRLRERKVVQWTAGYIAMSWVLLQLMDVLGELWGWSIVAQQAVSLLLGFGILPALVVAWFHGEKGRQDICPMEAAIVAASIMGSVFVVWTFCLTATT